MARLRVWAHWTDWVPSGQPQAVPVPPSLSTAPASQRPYPGAVPTIDLAAPPTWPGQPPGPVPAGREFDAWAELAADDDIAAAGWGGPGTWAGPPPPAWPSITGPPGDGDEGYDRSAWDFHVTRVEIVMLDSAAREFSVQVYDPSGAPAGPPIQPTMPGIAGVAVNVPRGRGIWRLSIDRQAGSSVPAPRAFGTVAPFSNAVREPFVSPSGHPAEGVLGVIFEGVEVPPPVGCCDGDVVVTRTTPVSCVPAAGGSSTVGFSASVSPPGCDTAPFEWRVTDLATGVVLAPYTAGGPAFSYTFTRAGDYRVSVRTRQSEDCDDPVPTGGLDVTVPVCGTKTCTVTIAGPTETPCSSGSPSGPQTYTAATDFPVSGDYTWDVKNATGGHLAGYPRTTSSATETVIFPGPGTYDVLVSVVTAPDCAGRAAPDNLTVVVPACPTTPAGPCAVTLTGPRDVPCVDTGPTAPQTYTATTDAAYSGAYTWEVRRQGGAALPGFPVTQASNTLAVAFPGPGTYEVVVSIATAGCAMPANAAILGITVPPCTTPGGGTDGGDGTDGGGTDGGGGSGRGFDWCCVLIVAWGIVHVIAGSLLFRGMWWAALGAGIVATILLVAWNGLCCWPCSRRPWRCCTLLFWLFLWHVILGVVLGYLAADGGGLGWVAAMFGGFTTVLGVLLGIARCGRTPNPFDPSTWPGCRCP